MRHIFKIFLKIIILISVSFNIFANEDNSLTRNKFLQIGKHKPFRVFSGDDVNFKKNILSKLNKKIIAILLFVAILGFFLI